MVSDAYVTQAQADAYNEALVQVAAKNYNITAQEYFDEQSATAMDALSDAVNTYTQASTDLIGAVMVNQMAIEATDQETTTALQTYVTNNELQITTESVDTYNGALDTVQAAAQTAASFMAVANDQELVGSAQAQADALGESFSFAEASFYAQSTVTVTMLSGDISLDVSGYLKTAEDILTAGAESDFYRTSPVGECFFTQDCYE
jgi:glutamate synthase domain-containing protein 2